MSGNGGADAVINGGSKSVCWCADVIREGRAAWPESSKELSSLCRVKIKNIAARLRACGNIKVLI
jgi:hypothetical protein